MVDTHKADMLGGIEGEKKAYIKLKAQSLQNGMLVVF